MTSEQPGGSLILGDIGGTNARFAVVTGGRLGPITRLAVADHASPGDALAAFLDAAKGVRATGAILAAAGPVDDNRCEMTNSGWVIDGAGLARDLGLERVLVINDFEAVAWSLAELGPEDGHELGGGAGKVGAPVAVLGPGTGLGVAGYVSAAGGPLVIATEGGHASLAATCAREEAVIAHLRERFGHVSAERVLSGAGLVNLREALAAVEGAPAPARTPEEITTAARAGECRLSVAAWDMFCAFLGGFAGDTALTFGARGGVWIGGGIVPQAPDLIARSRFRARFEAKGRYSDYLARIPVRAIVHPDPAFVGLGALAARGAP